jgi:hypothetical protein
MNGIEIEFNKETNNNMNETLFWNYSKQKDVYSFYYPLLLSIIVPFLLKLIQRISKYSGTSSTNELINNDNNKMINSTEIIYYIASIFSGFSIYCSICVDSGLSKNSLSFVYGNVILCGLLLIFNSILILINRRIIFKSSDQLKSPYSDNFIALKDFGNEMGVEQLGRQQMHDEEEEEDDDDDDDDDEQEDGGKYYN